MVNNVYAPVQIRRPCANHLAPVCAGQDIRVTLEDDHPVEAYWDKEFLCLDSARNSGKKWEFNFSQKGNQVNECSSTFLGEITFFSQTYHGSLCVVLNSSKDTTRDIITSINPRGQCLKVTKDQLLEVVVFDPDLGDNNDWHAFVEPGLQGLSFEKVMECKYKSPITRPRCTIFGEKIHGDKAIDDRLVFSFSRAPVNCAEFHFWFKFSGKSEDVATYLKSGVFEAGALSFWEAKQKQPARSLNLLLNLRAKKVKPVVQATSLVVAGGKDSYHTDYGYNQNNSFHGHNRKKNYYTSTQVTTWSKPKIRSVSLIQRQLETDPWSSKDSITTEDIILKLKEQKSKKLYYGGDEYDV